VTRALTARLGTPRLIVRTLIATFGAILLILATIFVVLTMETRSRAARVVADNLETTQRIFSAVEGYRKQQIALQLSNLANSPELGNALFLYETSRDPDALALPTLQHELERIAARFKGATVFVVDPYGTIVASAGPQQHAWARRKPVPAESGPQPDVDGEQVIYRPGGVFRVAAVPVPARRHAAGGVYLATTVDDGYAAELAAMTRTHVAVTLDRQLLGATLPDAPRVALRAAALAGRLPNADVLDLDGEQYAARRVLSVGPLELHALDSLDLSAHRANREALDVLFLIAIGALLLGAGASFWLARSVARPIDALSRELRQMAHARDFSRALPVTGSSRELDALTDTFNQLIGSLASAEQQTELAYVGAIKALAAALDCRDPYTAGHSERVSALSIMIGRQMKLDADQLDILRLGSLLHDIGKIGIRDNVLTKAGPLTPEEFEIIKTHPTLGGHILRQVPFLSKHLPIVELHHERPDGRGYPHGLLNHATPLLARIVHVADAFDAMTTARAYRPAGTPNHAITELWRYAGSQFDAEVVEAFVAAWSGIHVSDVRSSEVAGVLSRSGAVLTFPARIEEAGQSPRQVYGGS
jgi:HD-GYP domain-containing protein (c-di-GMP phosphodiesterase class II)